MTKELMMTLIVVITFVSAAMIVWHLCLQPMYAEWKWDKSMRVDGKILCIHRFGDAVSLIYRSSYSMYIQPKHLDEVIVTLIDYRTQAFK